MTEKKLTTTREKNKKMIKFVVLNGLIAGLYVVFTLPFANIAYGPIQFRLAEVLTVFPAFSALTIPGVTLGCFIANLINPNNLGPVDVIGGTLATLIAGYFSWLVGKKNKPLGIIPPIVFNGLIVGGYLPFLLVDEGSTVTAQAVGISMLSVAGSEAVLLVVLGLPLIAVISKTKLKDML
ncbi:MAG: QueT transporter family protein [Clostridiales bacterium]|nr:QueT transporter family protein [Clostridiales bacterium]